MTTTIQISAKLIEQFNNAAGLARAGDFESALVAWDRLLNPAPEHKKEQRFLSGDFLGQSYMRKGWVLMDLNRHAEACAVLEDEVMQPCLGQFNLENLYEYFFSYANALGNLGEVEPMDTAFCKAMNIAAEHLGDARRMHNCWNNLLYWGEQAGVWDYLLREAEACRQFATNVSDDELIELAQLNKALAMAHLGRNSAARSIVEPTKQRARAVGDAGVIARCDEVLRAIKD